MATAFSSTNFVQPVSRNANSNGRSHDKSLFDPFKTSSSFLGSTRKLRVNSVKLNQANVHRRSAVVAVSDVVKEKKVESSSNLVTPLLLPLSDMPRCSMENSSVAHFVLIYCSVMLRV